MSESVPGGPKATVIQTEELDPAAAGWLADRCNLVVFPRERLATVNGELSDVRGMVVRTYTKVDGQLLDHLPGLRVVGRAGVGLENIDVDACKDRGIAVVHTPDANSSAVAEYVFSMLFAELRRHRYLDVPVSCEDWCAMRRELRAPSQLCELTIGIIGLGRVGSRIARIASAFGANVLYHDIAEIPPANRHGAACVDRETLLSNSDIVTIHIDARPGNTGLFDAGLLKLLKPGAILVNTSRGQVINAGDLASHLNRNPAALALLDVHPVEPFPADYPLLGLPNARLSPHLAAATDLANRNMSWVVRDVWRVLRGERPEFAAEASK
ncbi:MAG: 3-phosphoglycerate dehydrogenase [Phycisphaerales bacterium]|nr:3-phosphoglycerate dehydrogenase [Phycisphaerales bacterium]